MTTAFVARRAGFDAAVAGALIIAAVSTVGDVIWFELQLPHRTIYGLMHGLVLCMAIGLYLGSLWRQLLAGGAAGGLIGLLAAASYYVLAPLAGPAVMFAVWMALWLAMAALVEWLEGAGIRWRPALIRAGIAAGLAGVAFYAISGIWLQPPAEGRNYLLHFMSWTVAYLPAFGALLYDRDSRHVRGTGGSTISRSGRAGTCNA